MASSNLQIDNRVVKDDQNCVRCKSILKDACLVPCGCRLCRVCINDLMVSGVQFCPGPSEECGGSPLSQFVTDYRADRNISNCQNNGCVHACPLVNMEEHLRVCPRKIVECPFRELGCTQDKMAAEDMSDHLQRESLSHSDILIGMINNVNNEIEGSKRDIEMMMKKDESINTDIEYLNKANKINRSNIDLLTNKCVRQDYKIEMLEEGDEDNKTEIEVLNERDKSNIGEIEVLKKAYIFHKNKINIFEKTVKSNKREIDMLKKGDADNKTEIEVLNEKDKIKIGEIEVLKKAYIFHKNKINMLKKTVESHKREINMLKKGDADNKTEIEVLNERDKSNVGEIEKTVESNKREINMLKKAEADNKTEIEMLKCELELKNAQIKSIMDEIKSMKEENTECTNRMKTRLAETKCEIDRTRDSSNVKVIKYVDKGSINQGAQSIRNDIDSIKSQAKVPTDDTLTETVLGILISALEKQKRQHGTGRDGDRNVPEIETEQPQIALEHGITTSDSLGTWDNNLNSRSRLLHS